MVSLTHILKRSLTLVLVFGLCLSSVYAGDKAEAEAKRREEEEKREQNIFAVVSALTSLTAIDFGFSLFRIGQSQEAREKLKLELHEKQAQLRQWAEHKDNLCQDCDSLRLQIEELRRSLPDPQGKLTPEQKQIRKETLAAIAAKETELSKLRGRMEQSPSAYTRIVENLIHLDQLDTQLEQHLDRLEKLAKSKNLKSQPQLRDAIREWKSGKGLLSLDAWMKTPEATRFFTQAGATDWDNDFKATLNEAGEKVRNSVQAYNDIAKERNKVLPQGKKLPFIDYRKSESGHYDTRNFDTRPDPTAPKQSPGGGSVSMNRSGFRSHVEKECGAGYEELAADVKRTERRTGFLYTYRDQLPRFGATSLGAGTMLGLNAYSQQKHKKSMAELQASSEAKDLANKTSVAALEGQMKREESERNRFAPFYNVATDSMKKYMDDIRDNMERSFAGDSDVVEKMARLNKQHKFASDGETIRKNIKNSLFSLMVEKKMTSIEQMLDAFSTKDEGVRQTILRAYVTETVYGALSNLYSGVSEKNALDRMDFHVVNKIIDEIVEGLSKKTEPAGAPVVPLPGLAPEPTKTTGVLQGISASLVVSDPVGPRIDAPLIVPMPGAVTPATNVGN